VLFRLQKTPHLPPTHRSGAASSPLPSREGRGGKGLRISLSFSKLPISERYYS
jgi:hypothetical protein